MLDKSFIQKIEEMASPVITHLDHYQPFSHKEMYPIRRPMAERIITSTLGSMLDYCDSALRLSSEQHYIHIVSPTTVKLFTAHRSRETLVEASADKFLKPFPFGDKLPVEQFIIGLQSRFVQSDTTAQILKLVGNMTTKTEVGTKDDGVTQRVEAKTGLAQVGVVAVPNPVILMPYRTFNEVEQPESKFVLRLDSDHRCALYEADGGAWATEAMDNIAAFVLNGIKSLGMSDNIVVLS